MIHYTPDAEQIAAMDRVHELIWSGTGSFADACSDGQSDASYERFQTIDAAQNAKNLYYYDACSAAESGRDEEAAWNYGWYLGIEALIDSGEWRDQ